VEKRNLRITPLLPERLVAIFPEGTRGLPDEVTPEFVARQPLLMEHTGGAVYALVMRWLSGLGSLPRPPMHLGTIEALRSAVASNLGMSIVPEIVVAQHSAGIIVRPLRPQLSRTLALIEHRNKPNERALEIVRGALLALKADGGRGATRSEPPPPARPNGSRSRRASTSRQSKSARA
jgi:DNA-binding transcriptional LysR family regulator